MVPASQIDGWVSVGIAVDAPVTAISNKTNDIQCFKDI